MDSRESDNHFPKKNSEGNLTEVADERLAWRLHSLPVEPSASSSTNRGSQLPQQPLTLGKWRRRFKGIGLSLILPICLGIVGFFMLLIWGDEGVQASRQWITMIWWPATFIRLFIYLLLSWLVLPKLLQFARAEAQSRIRRHREQLFALGYADLHQINELDVQEQRINQLSIPAWAAFCFLLLVELTFAQIPYLLF